MKLKILILLLSILFIIIIWRLNILSIEKVNVINFAECVSVNDLSTEINRFDKNSILISPERLKNELSSKYKCIKDISMSYEFPKTVNVNVYGRKFLTKIYSVETPLNLTDLEASISSETSLLDWNFPQESSEDAFVTDETGFVFTKVKPETSLPILFLNENIILGTQLDPPIFKSIEQIFSKILTLAPISYQPNFKAKKYSNILLINTSPKVAFSLEKDILRQLASLQLILQKAKIDERVAEFIDLRFDKPVVQYRTK
ncbi:MAG: hypothetical protein WCV81_02200 [Microgenomates group bacterium]|jgi:hypothetical protein